MQTWESFEQIAGNKMAVHYGVTFAPATIEGVPKRFDHVSEDRRIVGDSKFFSFGTSVPWRKRATIAEHVWLLQKTPADVKFLVFGNDRRLIQAWLTKYGHLAGDVEFFFIDDAESIYRL